MMHGTYPKPRSAQVRDQGLGNTNRVMHADNRGGYHLADSFYKYEPQRESARSHAARFAETWDTEQYSPEASPGGHAHRHTGGGHAHRAWEADDDEDDRSMRGSLTASKVSNIGLGPESPAQVSHGPRTGVGDESTAWARDPKARHKQGAHTTVPLTSNQERRLLYSVVDDVRGLQDTEFPSHRSNLGDHDPRNQFLRRMCRRERFAPAAVRELPNPLTNEPDVDDRLQDMFDAFNDFGRGNRKGRSTLIDSFKYQKLLRESRVLDDHLTPQAADIVFHKVCGYKRAYSKQTKKLTYAEFRDCALPLLAAEKGAPNALALALGIVESQGPLNSGTMPEVHRLHDDPENYTGVYAAGGPVTVDLGNRESPICTFDLAHMMDRTKPDVRAVNVARRGFDRRANVTRQQPRGQAWHGPWHY